MKACGRCVLLLLIADGVSVVAGRIDTVINRQKTGLLNIIQGEAEQRRNCAKHELDLLG